jgi:hypothetical protein
MLYKPSKELDKFCNTVMEGNEWEAYTLHYKRLIKEQNQSGHFTFLINGEKRTLKIEFYMSKKLDVLFGIIGYIVRPGEPRRIATDALKEYLAVIKEAEDTA